MGNFVRLTLAPLLGVGLIVYETVWGQRSATVYMVALSLVGVTPFLGEAGFRAVIEALGGGRTRRNGSGNGNGNESGGTVKHLMVAVAGL